MADIETDILLIGGGVASARCARQLRRDGFDGRILLVGDEPMPPYNRPPLSKELLRDDLPDDLVLAEPPSWYERRGIELRTDARVVALDPDARSATLEDGSTIRFDRCLLATGAEPRKLPVPGAEHALMLRTLADARRIREAAVRAGRDAEVVVVGGGFIGLEVASSLATLGLRPAVVELGQHLWAGSMGEELSRWAVWALATNGVEVRLGAGVSRVEQGAAWVGTERVPAAFVVAGIGVVPRDGLAASAGLETEDGIVTDATHRTSHPAIWAAGDVARRTGRRIEHWHAAREGGERAARAMLGADIGSDPAPWVFSDVAGHQIDVVGAPDAWGRETWVVPDRLLAHLDGDRVVQVASIDAAAPVEVLRRLVAEGIGLDGLRTAAQAIG
ncbi:MAG TPA: FAD-dependent oxidoreductase [Candidatus Limnocylindria bacterium]|nr:FAD-dependent oxidoreductase [Candidatus Limnocylindria bacterium]